MCLPSGAQSCLIPTSSLYGRICDIRSVHAVDVDGDQRLEFPFDLVPDEGHGHPIRRDLRVPVALVREGVRREAQTGSVGAVGHHQEDSVSSRAVATLVDQLISVRRPRNLAPG